MLSKSGWEMGDIGGRWREKERETRGKGDGGKIKV
jgi:hypothetical protein